MWCVQCMDGLKVVKFIVNVHDPESHRIKLVNDKYLRVSWASGSTYM